MKTINNMPRFLVYAVSQAIRHPRTSITYLYCPECKVRLTANSKKCPVCQKKTGNSPEIRRESPIPWWGSVVVIVIGITCWCAAAYFNISGLDEAGRALVYIPLGSLFGMSIPR
jgi:hypothetical protein